MEKKNLVMIMLCIAIVVMSIGYAAFSSTLNVSGTIQSSGNFSITYQSGATCTGTKVGSDTPIGSVIVTPGTTTATLNVSLYTPGDVVTCTIPVKNTGNIMAKYDGEPIVSNGLTANSKPISVIASNPKEFDGVEWIGPEGILVGDTHYITVVVKYNWDEETQPESNDLIKTFTITSNFVQWISSFD